MATAYVEESIARDDLSERDLLLDEDNTKGNIIKNQNYKDKKNDSMTKQEESKGEKEKERKGEKKKQSVEDEEEVEQPNNSDPETDNYRFNLCGAGNCPPHFSCQNNERINNILQVRRRHNTTELILKIISMSFLLVSTAVVFYSYGKARGEIEQRQEAKMLKSFDISVTTESTSIIKAKVFDPIYNDTDEDETENTDDNIENTKKEQGQDGQDNVDNNDFHFDDTDQEKEAKQDDKTKDTTTRKPIVVSFWPR